MKDHPTRGPGIERAATKSSVSGRPCLVKCGETPAVPGGAWLDAELGALRDAREDAAPPR